MLEINQSVQQVSGINSEIAAADAARSERMVQVVAGGLGDEAERLSRAIPVFKLDNTGHARLIEA